MAFALSAAPLGGAVAVAAASAEPGAYHFLVTEDSLLEWAQLAAYLLAAALWLRAALAVGRGARVVAGVFLLVGAGCVFTAGEEISWGQRVLGFETPETVARFNVQGETTVHNLASARSGFDGALVAAGLYGLLAPVSAAGRRLPETLRLLVPPLFLAPAFGVLFAYEVIRLVFFPHPTWTLAKYSEWPEFCLAAGLALFALLVWRRLQRGPDR